MPRSDTAVDTNAKGDQPAAGKGMLGRTQSIPTVATRVSELLAQHERTLMRVARHWSNGHHDALDAYQRALEIYIRRVGTLDPATELAWLKVVVKHEALAIRRQHTETLSVDDIDQSGNARAIDEQRPVEDLLAGRERVQRSAEALRHLKPDEARALMLKAEGLSYLEIATKLGWTYTKVNRCITEGRARFLTAYAAIETGTECERFAPTLTALAEGSASAGALIGLRPHIRHCAHCRATIRRLHATRLGRFGALFPMPALVAATHWVRVRLGRAESREPAPGDPMPGLHHEALPRTGDALAGLKQHAAGAYARALDPAPLAGIRPGAAVAAVAGCLALGGGATYCVKEGVGPIAGLPRAATQPHERAQSASRAHRVPPKRVTAVATPEPIPAVVATPTSTPEPPQHTPVPTPEPTPTPTPMPEDEYEPVGAAASVPAPDPRPARTPAPAPSGGAEEFDGP